MSSVETIQEGIINISLMELLDSIEEQEVEELKIQKAGFIVEDDRQANYVLKKIKDLNKEIENIQNTAKEELERYRTKVESWEESSTASLVNSRNYLTSLLKDYVEIKLADTKSKKSVKFIEGTCGFRAKQDKFEYVDTEILEYLTKEKLNQYIRMTPSVDKKSLKNDGVRKNGTLFISDKPVKGITVIPQEDEFYIK